MLESILVFISPRASRSCTASRDTVSVIRILLLGLVASVLLMQPSAAQPGEGRSPRFNGALNAIVKRSVPQDCQISMQVVDVDSGEILMEKNPGLALVPASTLKVLTSAAALQVLGPEYTFTTEVLADDMQGASVGNLFLRGRGDPYLVTEELFVLTRGVKDLGLVEVRGNIIVDDSYFLPGKPLDENEELGPRAYHAPYSALSLNFNSLKLVLLPTLPGKPAKVLTDPISEYGTVENEVRTVKGDLPAKVEITKKPGAHGRDIIHVQGEIGASAQPWRRYVNVSTPALYTGEVFKEFLLREGIKIGGRVLLGRAPESAHKIHEFNSRPLGLIVYGLNKFSNNFIAEQLCLAMGATVAGPPGTREKGLSVIRRFVEQCGVDTKGLRLSEASGLSRQNRVSAAVLVRVLLKTFTEFTYGPEFMASLSVAGVDGTLKDKFTAQELRGRLRAKTGNLRGVNALAGYGLSQEGRLFAFACLVNSTQEKPAFINHSEKLMRAVLELPLPHR